MASTKVKAIEGYSGAIVGARSPSNYRFQILLEIGRAVVSDPTCYYFILDYCGSGACTEDQGLFTLC